jgi:hypothetical protein
MAGSKTTSSDGAETVWHGGNVRRLVLAFAFLLLLPFYASIGPMLYQRVSHGLIADAVSLGVLGLVFSTLMGLILHQLVHAVRTRVAVDSAATALIVPTTGKRGPFSVSGYTKREIPHTDVAAVETRSEVYGGALAPVLLTSTRLTTKDGQHVVLGYTNANDQDDQIPYPAIGAEIARRAGVTMADHGVVRRSLQKAALPAEEIAAINAAHTRNMRLLVAALALLVLGGITLDFATASRTGFAGMGTGLAEPAAVKKK